MLGCIQPISSPMMNRMFGCCACWGACACACAGLVVMAVVRTVAANSAARDADRMCVRLLLSHDLSVGIFKSSVEFSLRVLICFLHVAWGNRICRLSVLLAVTGSYCCLDLLFHSRHVE